MPTNFSKKVNEDFLIYSVLISIQKRAGTTDASRWTLVLFTQLNTEALSKENKQEQYLHKNENCHILLLKWEENRE